MCRPLIVLMLCCTECTSFLFITAFAFQHTVSCGLGALRNKSSNLAPISRPSTAELFAIGGGDEDKNGGGGASDEGGAAGGGLDDDDTMLFDSLRRRREQLRAESDELERRWRDAKCRSGVRLALDGDWIRRVDVGRWPLVALGSASGSVHVGDLNAGEVLASAKEVHMPTGGDPNAIHLLHGDFDGGGPLAVCMRGDRVVSAGREGGAKAWHVDAAEKRLVALGEVTSLRGVLVTSLRFDSDEKLWAGCFDGTIHQFDCGSGAPVQKPLTLKAGSAVLDFTVCEDIGLVAAATSSGHVKLFSTDGSQLGSWKPFFKTHARSVGVVGADDDKWCVVCGGGDGTMYIRRLRIDPSGVVDARNPFDAASGGGSFREMHPRHSGSVVSISSRPGGILISGAHDGSLRVWDCFPSSDDEAGPEEGSDTTKMPRVLYNLIGYKVWLGSVCTDTDGVRLVSDGADNTIVVHDFSVPIEFDI